MPFAARVGDPVSHPLPTVLTGGPGSTTVFIGGLPAWRALPAALGSAVQAASEATHELMQPLVLTPVEAKVKLAAMTTTMTQAAAVAAGLGNPAVVATSTAAIGALQATDVTLSSTWTTASAAPGGQPAANEAYASGLQTAVAAASGAVFGAIGAMFDMHTCTTPLVHGPGLVTVGSAVVTVNGLPLARQGDSVMEAAGGANPIAMGCPKVIVGQ